MCGVLTLFIRPLSRQTGRRAAQRAILRKQPRNASAARVRNRDSVDGRPRGYLCKFGLSRVRTRQPGSAPASRPTPGSFRE